MHFQLTASLINSANNLQSQSLFNKPISKYCRDDR